MSTTGLTDFNGIIHPSVIGLFPQLHKLGNVEGGVDVPINLVKGLDETQCMTTLHQLLGNPSHIASEEHQLGFGYGTRMVLWKLHVENDKSLFEDVNIEFIGKEMAYCATVKVCTTPSKELSNEFSEWYSRYKGILNIDIRKKGGLARFRKGMGIDDDSDDDDDAMLNAESYIDTAREFQKKHPYRVSCFDSSNFPVASFCAFGRRSPYNNGEALSDRDFNKYCNEWLYNDTSNVNIDYCYQHFLMSHEKLNASMSLNFCTVEQSGSDTSYSDRIRKQTEQIGSCDKHTRTFKKETSNKVEGLHEFLLQLIGKKKINPSSATREYENFYKLFHMWGFASEASDTHTTRIPFLRVPEIEAQWVTYCGNPASQENYERFVNAFTSHYCITIPIIPDFENMIKATSLTPNDTSSKIADASEINFVIIFPRLLALVMEMLEGREWTFIRNRPTQKEMEDFICCCAPTAIDNTGDLDMKLDRASNQPPYGAVLFLIEIIQAAVVHQKCEDLIRVFSQHVLRDGKSFIYTCECLWKYTNLVSTKLSHSLHKNIQRLLGTEPYQYAELCDRKICLQTVMKYGMTLSLMKEMIYFFDMYTLCPLILLEPIVDQGGHRSTRGYNGNVPCQPSDEELHNAINERMEIYGGNNQLRRVLLAANNLKPSLGQSKSSPVSADKDLVIKYLLRVYQTIAEQKDGSNSKTPKNPFQPDGRIARLNYNMVRDHVNNMLEKEYPIGLCIFVQVHQIHIWNSTNVMHVHKDMVIERNSTCRGTKRDRLLFLKEAEGHAMGEELTHLSDLGIEWNISRRLTLTDFGAIVFEPTTALVNITDMGRIVLAEQASNFHLEGTGDDEGLSQSNDGKEQSDSASEEASSLNRNDDDESSSWLSPEGMSSTGRASPDGMSSTGRNDDDELALRQAGDSDMSIAGRNDDDELALRQAGDSDMSDAGCTDHMSDAGCSTAIAEQFLDDDGALRQESISPSGMSITGRASPDGMNSTGWSTAVADDDDTLPSWDIDSLSLTEDERLFFKTYDREPSDNPLVFDQSPLPPPLPLLAGQLLDDDGASRQESISPEGMSSTGWMSEMILRMAELERHAIANDDEHEIKQSEFGTLLRQDFFKLERWYYSRLNQPRESSVDGQVEV